jgi:hypothetical protein
MGNLVLLMEMEKNSSSHEKRATSDEIWSGKKVNYIAKRSHNFAFYILIFKFLSSLSLPGPPKPRRRRLPLKSLVLISVHSWFNFVHFVSFVVKLPKMKTKPKQSQTKPIFRRSIFDFSKKTRIFEDFRQTFLCKTNPMVCNRYSNCRGV